MKKIILTQGKFALVDDEDYDFLNQWKWCYSKSYKDLGYAIRFHYLTKSGKQQKRKVISMHRVIMNTPIGMYTDHINHNTLDNRKENLRICTPSQNHMNQRKFRGKSKYKGVFWQKDCPINPWGAIIRINKKGIYLGSFPSEERAARAYDEAAILNFKEFASLNFVGSYI